MCMKARRFLIKLKELKPCSTVIGFPDSSVGKESAGNARDPSSIPGLGRSPEEGNPVFWPREFHGHCSPWGHRVRHDRMTFHLLSIVIKVDRGMRQIRKRK